MPISQEQLEKLRELSKRNEKLQESLDQFLSRYDSINAHGEQYEALLREFGLADESRKQQKDIKRFKMASMLYIVVHGFDELSRREDSHLQLDKLDEIFINIGLVAKKYNLAKIPTVGDNVLLVGGVPNENKTNSIDAALAAIEIRERMRKLRESGNYIWEVGIGIHTGPVMARFDGKKTPYTLSGNNVLTATRLGLIAKRGHIAISPMTYELSKEFFEVEKSCHMPVKYSGSMDVYDMVGIMPSLVATEGSDKMYNADFELRYDRLQFIDIQECVLEMLEKQLPADLYYHNVKHTIDVTTEVELIGWAEGISESDIMLLKVAALFHDSGHIVAYKGHEEKSCEYAEQMLPRYNYSEAKIEKIKRIIMATKLPHTPSDILEAIIQDSDLDYLGRSDFIPVSNMLYRELKERNMIGTMDQWNEMQIKFISGHQYYTHTAHAMREVNKQIQIEHIRELLQSGVE